MVHSRLKITNNPVARNMTALRCLRSPHLCLVCPQGLFAFARLWGELDTEKTGFISLKEIDPKAGREVMGNAGSAVASSPRLGHFRWEINHCVHVLLLVGIIFELNRPPLTNVYITYSFCPVTS